MAAVIAFFLSSRLNWMVKIPSCLLVRMSMSLRNDRPRLATNAPACFTLHPLENPGGAHAGADAHGHHAVFELVAAQGMDQGGGADGTGRTQRVAQGNRPAHRVDFRRIKTEVVDHRQ